MPASVGDSRAVYLLDESGLHQLSTDHTWVQEAIDHDVISVDEAHDHPHAHVLRVAYIAACWMSSPTFCLRGRSRELPTIRRWPNQGLRLMAGLGKFCLCSDGLTDLVRAFEIERRPEGAIARAGSRVSHRAGSQPAAGIGTTSR